MTTYISLHDIKTMRASTVQGDCAPHITLEFVGAEYDARVLVTVYLPDAAINAHLIALINEALNCVEAA